MIDVIDHARPILWESEVVLKIETKEGAQKQLQNNSAAILVIGDAMIDEHLFGKTTRISPEAPVPIIQHGEERKQLGGAANVAAHIASANIPCIFVYKSVNFAESILCGEHHKDLWAMINRQNITPEPLQHQTEHWVTTKKRIWSNGQQICRIDIENIDPPTALVENQWFQKIVELFDKYNINTVILSDYNKGTLTDNLINMIASYCKEINVQTILDPKRPSFPSLKNITVAKPNRREIESTNCAPHKCSTIMRDTFLVNTLGKDGVTVWQRGKCIFSHPTVAEEVVDVCGCGDTVMSLLGISLYNNLSIQESVIAANKAASYTIKHIGSYCLTYDEILESMKYAKKNFNI